MNLAGVDQYVKPLPPQGVERYVKPLHDYSRTQVKLAGDDAEDARPLPENDSPIKPRRSRQGQSIESANVPEAARRMKMSEEGFKRWWANEGGTLTINADDAPREMPLEHQSGPQETPPMPETRATVDAQIKAMREGRRKAVLVTPGTEMPPVPRGYTSTATAQGIFIHHPRRVSRDLVTQLANEDRHGELLGHVEPKSEATTAVVRASDPATGTEQQTSYVSPARVPAQVDELRRQFPASDIEAGGAETDARLLSDRAAQLSAEQQQQTPTTPAPLKVDSKYVRPLEPAAPSSLIPHSSPHVTSRIVEEDAPAEYLNEIAPPATAGGFPFVPVTFTLAKDQGPLESLSPTALSRRALFQYAQTHGVPDDFTKEFLDREDLAGHLHPFEISSGNEASTADILNDPQAFDPQTNAVTLKLRKSFADKLLDEWEQNKPYTTRIAEDYQAGKPAGTIAYDVVAPPVAAAARGVEIASRPVRAASTLVNAPEQAKLALARRIAGDPDAHPLDVLKDAPSAALHELATGEGDPRYENPLTTVTQDVARQTLAKINPTLPGFARVVTDVVGDPLVLLGVAGKIGKAGELARISRAARAGEEVADSATVESRLASIADSIEQRTGVRPSLKVQPDNSIRVAADFGGSPVEFTVPPGGKGLRLPSLPEAPAPKIEPVVFDHPELGRVVVADSQEDVPRGFMRVAEMENPEAEHVVNSSRLALPSSASTRPGLGAYALDLWNASRSFKTSYDLSAPRNSLVLSLTRPVHAARAFSAQVKALRSEGAAMNFMRAIDADAIKPVADEAGLQLTRLDGSVAGREEMFRSAIAERIPGVRASERAFHTYLNQLRFSVFKDYALSHPGATPEDLKGVARAINFFTGRGSFGRLENSKIVTGLSEAFYAPRLNLSYVQSLASPAMGTAAARKFAARHVAQFVGTGLAVGGLIKATSKQTGIDFEADPRSSDFGKIKVGRNRVNLFGGFSALARYTAQAITGEGKSDSGRVYEKSRVQTALDYGRTRLHPSAGFILDLKTGETVDRRKLYKDGSPDASALIRDALMPLSAGDIYDAVEEDRAEGGSGLKGLAFAPAALTGFDVQTRTPKPATDNQQDYIFQLAEHSKQDADEVSRRLTGRAVDKLSADEAKQVIDELKKSARLPARGRPLVGVEKYVQPLDAERRGPSQQSIP